MPCRLAITLPQLLGNVPNETNKARQHPHVRLLFQTLQASYTILFQRYGLIKDSFTCVCLRFSFQSCCYPDPPNIITRIVSISEDGAGERLRDALQRLNAGIVLEPVFHTLYTRYKRPSDGAFAFVLVVSFDSCYLPPTWACPSLCPDTPQTRGT